jgi:hypothetical protein
MDIANLQNSPSPPPPPPSPSPSSPPSPPSPSDQRSGQQTHEISACKYRLYVRLVLRIAKFSANSEMLHFIKLPTLSSIQLRRKNVEAGTRSLPLKRLRRLLLRFVLVRAIDAYHGIKFLL